jgi:hypothetical protein
VRTFRATLLALAGAMLLAAPAVASEDDWPVLKGARLDGQMPWGAFAVYRLPGQPTQGVTLFLRGEDELIARKVETDDGAAPTVTWTSSQACSALAPALAELEKVPPAHIDVPAAGESLGAASSPEGGASYFIWVQDARLADTHSAQLEIRALDGSPVAAWMTRTIDSLAACWSPRQP